jgi:hypothetical protein
MLPGRRASRLLLATHSARLEIRLSRAFAQARMFSWAKPLTINVFAVKCCKRAPVANQVESVFAAERSLRADVSLTPPPRRRAVARIGKLPERLGAADPAGYLSSSSADTFGW